MRALGRRLFSSYFVLEAQGPSLKPVHARVPLLRSPQFLGHVSERGMRATNEDRYFAGMLQLPDVSGTKMLQVFNVAVFDGHGGSECAQWLSEHLAEHVESQAVTPDASIATVEAFREEFGGYWRAFRSTLQRYDRELKRSRFDDMALRLPLAYLRADLDICRGDKLTGSTCTSAYLYSVPSADGRVKNWWELGARVNLTVAQIGDSRCLIADNQGNCRPLSTVHHASNPHEWDRLKKYELGFNLTSDGHERFLQYVNTRAFGDAQGKSRGISAEPDLVSYQINGDDNSRDLPGDEAFLLLVSDGVTDVASDQELTDIVIQTAVSGGSLRGTPQDAAAEVISYVDNLGTRDNSTAVVVRLGGWGQWSQWSNRSGAEREQKLRSGPQRRQ